jgi:microcystin-dependent protein
MEGAYFGEIRMFAGTFAPIDWAFCEGQMLPVRAHSQLFAVLGTKFGGDGVTNFGLPNLNRKIPIGAGAGPGLTPRAFAETGGSPTYTLTIDSTPPHSHAISGTLDVVSTKSPANAYFGSNAARTTARFKSAATPPEKVLLARTSIKAGGNSVPVSNIQPSLTVSFIVCINGEIPPKP